jgi:hypothetical protein
VKILPVVSMTTVCGGESGYSHIPPRSASERADDGDGRLVASARPHQASCQATVSDRSLFSVEVLIIPIDEEQSWSTPLRRAAFVMNVENRGIAREGPMWDRKVRAATESLGLRYRSGINNLRLEANHR